MFLYGNLYLCLCLIFSSCLGVARDVCQIENHNTIVNAKCFGAVVINLIVQHKIDSKDYANFIPAICRAMDSIKECVREEGGFCEDRDKYGPTLVEFHDVLCSDDLYVRELIQVLTSLDGSAGEDETSAFSRDFRRCIEEQLGVENFGEVLVPTSDSSARSVRDCFLRAVEEFYPEHLDKTKTLVKLYYSLTGFDLR